MRKRNNEPSLILEQEVLAKVQMLAAGHPETGINPDSLIYYSHDELLGIYEYLRRAANIKDNDA